MNAKLSISGEWNYAEDAEVCVRPSNWLRPVVACLPAWFRFAQVMEKEWLFDYIQSFSKYLLS